MMKFKCLSFLIVFLSCFIVLQSCSNDKEENDVDKSFLVGKWHIYYLDDDYDYMDYDFIIKEDGTFTYDDNGDDQVKAKGTWTVQNDKIYWKGTYTCPYTDNGKEQTINVTSTIVSITTNKVEIYDYWDNGDMGSAIFKRIE